MKPTGFELDHAALGVPRIAEAVPFVVGELGGALYESGPGLGFRWVQWRFANGGILEVLEPAGEPGGFLHRFLERRGPGVHHVTFKVPSLEAAAERARGCGYEIVGWYEGDPGWKECFLHPKQAQGIVVQLAQSSPGPAPAEPVSWPRVELPPGPADPPPSVELLGLRLWARDAGSARRQWQEALGGRVGASGPGWLEFRWERSPMRIVVEIQPAAEPGPRSVELACQRPWPEGGREALGTRFVRVAG